MEKKQSKLAKLFGLKKSDTKTVDDKTVQTSQNQQKHQSGQALMLLGTINNINYYIQVYNFTKKKWSPPQKVTDIRHIMNFQSAILNDKLYYMTQESGRYNLQVFNPFAQHVITKLRYPFIIFEWSAMCACSQYLYFVGGSMPPTDQVLRYDPQANNFEVMPPMSIKRFAAAAVFFQGYLHVLGGTDGVEKFTSVEKYDPDTRTWTTLAPMREERFFHATAVLNGKLYVCGGYPKNSVEVYDPATNRWQQVSSMIKIRSHYWVMAHGGMLYAIGGVDAGMTIEMYDPSKDQWQIQHEMSAGIELGYIETCWLTNAS